MNIITRPQRIEYADAEGSTTEQITRYADAKVSTSKQRIEHADLKVSTTEQRIEYSVTKVSTTEQCTKYAETKASTAMQWLISNLQHRMIDSRRTCVQVRRESVLKCVRVGQCVRIESRRVYTSVYECIHMCIKVNQNALALHQIVNKHMKVHTSA